MKYDIGLEAFKCFLNSCLPWVQTTSSDFQAIAQALGQLLGMEWPVLHHQTRSALGVLAKALPQASSQDWSFCALPDSETICAALKTGNELLGQHREISSKLSAPWPAELQTRMSHAIDLLDKHRTLHTELGTPWPPAVSDEIERGVQLIEEISQLRAGLSVKYGSGVGQLNVSQLQRDWAKAEKAFWPMSWLGKRKVRSALEGFAAKHAMRFTAPPLALCTDNAAMIAWAGCERLADEGWAAGKDFAGDSLEFVARPRWPLDASAQAVRGAGVKG